MCHHRGSGDSASKLIATAGLIASIRSAGLHLVLSAANDDPVLAELAVTHVPLVENYDNRIVVCPDKGING